jgi:hypothetical protein
MIYEPFSCRRRIRTFTGQLALAQIRLVVNPLCYVYPGLPTPETRGHVCQFHHPTVSIFDQLDPKTQEVSLICLPD